MDWIRSLASFLYDLLFGCPHDRQTRPFTLEHQTYKVCLDCGRQIYYSAERMSPLTQRELREMQHGRAVEPAAVPMLRPSLVARSDHESNAAA